MSAVICFIATHGGVSRPHAERADCEYPHYVAPGGPEPSMTAVETLDPREAVAS